MGEIGNLWVTIGAKTQGLQQGLSQAKKGMKDTQTAGSSLKETMKSAATAVAALGVAYLTLKSVLDQTVGATLAYSDKVRDLGRMTGESAEESSRMIQLADDLQISYESLTTSLKIASRNGIEPTTESLAQMSDEYLKLAPGVERNSYLLKAFGRSGLDMAKAMEKGGSALRNMIAEQPKSLLLTEKQLKQARLMEIQLDAVSDSWEAIKLSAGSAIIGFADTEKVLVPIQAMMQTMSEFDSKNSWNPIGLIDWAKQYIANIDQIVAAQDNLVQSMSEKAGTQMPPYLQSIVNGASLAVTKLGEAKLAIIDLSMAGMGQETLTNLDQALADKKIKQEEYNAAAEYTMRTLLGMSDTEIAGFEKIAALNADLANSDLSAWDYAAGMQEVYKWLANIKGLGPISLPLATGGNISKQKGGVQEGFGGASGGSFVVPAGYLGDSYAVRASSGEKVTIERNGGKGKSGGVQVYGNITFMVPQGTTTARALFESFQESMSA